MVSLGRLVAAGLVAFTVCPAAAARAQGPAYLPLDEPAAAYVDALVARGALPRLSALERPYVAADLLAAIDSALAAGDARLIAPRAWYEEVRRVAIRYAGASAEPGSCDGATPQASCSGAARDSGSALLAGLSLTPYVTAQTTGRRELMIADGAGGVPPGADIRFALGSDAFAGVARLRLDRALKADPEFTGKKDRSITARMQDAYLVARSRYALVSAGRVARNWGPAPLDGLQVGAYADTYDHLFVRLGVERLHLTSVVARLDDMTIGADSVAQRYFTAHRLSARWRELEVAVGEAVVYGGIARGFEPSLANPFTLLDLLQYTERKSLNVNYALDLTWRPGARGLYSAQLLIDDFQLDKCGVQCAEPASIGYSMVADAVPFVGSARAFASYTRVTNLTYRSALPWERYASFDLSLGRGQSDYDEARAGVELTPPLGGPLRVYGAYRRQGEGDYRQPFPAVSDNPITPAIFAGVVTRVARAGAAWSRSGRVSWTADVGYNRVSNADHVAGRRRSGVEGRIRVSVTPLIAAGGVLRH